MKKSVKRFLELSFFIWCLVSGFTLFIWGLVLIAWISWKGIQQLF